MTAFFDTSALIALANPEEPNHAWSRQEFEIRQQAGPVVINDIVYAEISAGYDAQNDVDLVLAKFGFERADCSDEALFNAGQRFKRYKHAGGGPKQNVLPDFFIGAAAQSLGIPLITANPRDFRKFFSGLEIVSPGGTEVVP
jgi:predicted nucleic acid-binding protein